MPSRQPNTAAPSLAVALTRLSDRYGAASTAGVVPTVRVHESAAWRPAADIVDGNGFEDLVNGPVHRWGAPRHAAASLAWKAYSYWLAMPVVLAWTIGASVPRTRPDDVLVQLDDSPPFIRIGFRAIPRANSSPDRGREPDDIAILAGDEEMAQQVSTSLMELHLEPLMNRLARSSRVRRRVLRGELAYGLARIHQQAASSSEAPQMSATFLVDRLGLHGLVDLVPMADRRVQVQRRTCCLALTVPGLDHRICADCVVPPTRAGARTTAAAPPTEEQAQTTAPATGIAHETK